MHGQQNIKFYEILIQNVQHYILIQNTKHETLIQNVKLEKCRSE